MSTEPRVEKMSCSLQESLEISESELDELILTAPTNYKTYQIPKKSGGMRSISQPAKETKRVQYWLIKNTFQILPVHQCAMAYMEGASIKKNASLHKNNSYLTKFDFKDFFTSIKASDLTAHFSRYLKPTLSDEDIRDIIRISCIEFKNQNELCLSIGAPSSPLLSNSIMFEFDSRVFAWCQTENITYTRYADDLTFSTNTKGISSRVEHIIRTVIKIIAYPRLSLNTKKSTHLSCKHQRRITGLIINNEGNISLGRKRKREISVLIHKFSIGQLAEDDTYRLQGLLGFTMDVEPSFLVSMKLKYSSKVIREILQNRKINTTE